MSLSHETISLLILGASLFIAGFGIGIVVAAIAAWLRPFEVLVTDDERLAISMHEDGHRVRLYRPTKET